jgi:ATP-binding cassette subfamily B protein
MGPSGCGKTTFISVLMCLIRPDSGAISIDGHDLRDLTTSSFRRQCSVVLQDTLLLAGTLRENLAAGLPDATEADIIAAAQLADAHDFIMRLPMGYDTPVGERGVTLSAGQRQRIAVARAAIRHAPLIILDEPTTGLDDVSKAQVVGAIDRLAQGRTTFFITHEVLLSCDRADLVVWLEHGRVIECGAPATLLARGGPYARAVSAASRISSQGTTHALAG